MVTRILPLAIVMFWPVLVVGAATAVVDRNPVDANETFTLTLSINKVLSDPPDLTPLEKDFEILNVSASSRAGRSNGRIVQLQSYSVTLLPRRAGELAIPPLAIGGERTEPVTLEVNPSNEQAVTGGDLFIVAELDRESTWVQAQAVLSIRIYAAIAPRQPQLVPPKVSGAEVQVQPIGEDARYDAEIEGRVYDVLERRYALYPQQSGIVKIGEAVYAARLWERGRLSGRKVFRSEPLELLVEPVPQPPPTYPDAKWFPAEAVSLSQRWNPQLPEMTIGEPVTREIEIAAVGLMANQIPPLQLEEVAGLKIYPDQPDLETTRRAQGFTGFRMERFALIANRGGQAKLPAIEVPWWNVNERRWEIASLAAEQLTVVGEPEPEEAPLRAPNLQESPARDGGVSVTPVWFWTTWLSGGLWLATLLWFFLRTKKMAGAKPVDAPQKPRYKLQREALKRARLALERDDDAQLISELLDWAAMEYRDLPTRSLTAVATRTPGDTGTILAALDASRYGQAVRPGRPELMQVISALGAPGKSLDDPAADNVLPSLTP